jgi:catechol 2,3-dioxygenase-like lactoylglutathione lyase family enzyme
MSDLGLTHIAFVVRDLERSIGFYQRYAAMKVVHRRPGPHPGSAVAWLSDLTRPFVIVLIQSATMQDRPLGPFGHLGVGCATREEVDRLCAQARAEDVLVSGPTDSGPPVGYWAFLRDPDGNTLEIAFGQEVAFTVDHAAEQEPHEAGKLA